MNCVRKHPLPDKGRAIVENGVSVKLSLAISDVPGDDISVIASGPASACFTPFRCARRIGTLQIEIPGSAFSG
ncbi:glycerate-2-kinase family protein [Vibrio chagasii]|nr:glycerate-2-kinase family protein [Vibrio chagasii]